MRNLVALLFIIIIVLTSCEGRISTHQALTESINDFNKTATLEVDVYIPEMHLENEVDTLLNNGYKVNIKTYSDSENNVLFTKIKDTINYQTYYRNFKFDIHITKKGKTIYNKHFNKKIVNEKFKLNNIQNSNDLLYNFDKLSVLKSIQLNDNAVLNNQVGIDILYSIPETNRQALFALFINDDGTSSITNLELK